MFRPRIDPLAVELIRMIPRGREIVLVPVEQTRRCKNETGVAPIRYSMGIVPEPRSESLAALGLEESEEISGR
jgi:hypothetical protein